MERVSGKSLARARMWRRRQKEVAWGQIRTKTEIGIKILY